MPAEKGVEAVNRAVALLECFDGAEPSLSLAELSRRSGFYKSTILRLATSLELAGFMLRREDGRYGLGPGLWRLGSIYRTTFGLAEIIRPALRALSDETRETASLYVREGSMRVCLYRAEPERAIRHTLNEGALLSLESGASALVLRAWPPLAEPALSHVVEAGQAISRGARDPEVAAVAAPLLDRNGDLRGALSISGLVTRFDDAACARFGAALRSHADRLAQKLDSLAN